MDFKQYQGGNGDGGKRLKPEGPPAPSYLSNILTVLLVFLLLVSAYSFFAERKEKTEVVSLSQLAVDIRQQQVKEVAIDGADLHIVYTDDAKKDSKKELEGSFTDTMKNYGVSPEDLGAVKITISEPSGFWYWFYNLSPFLLPLLFLFILFWFLSRQVKSSGGMQAFSFGQSKARVIYPDDTAQKVTFKDVAGVKEAKEELEEIVQFLKHPQKFLDIGAQIPKGVMLMGGPGTGKTLLARAVAGEAGVPFFYLSGSEFVEMFVGVGASRVRDLFQMVKKEAPAIIFIDEIDAVGRVRGTGVGGGNDEREQTLNQILVEMDGFEPNEKVIVMAATNRPDVLDPALLRPGRFDRRVVLDLPDLADREQILGIHARKKPLAEDVNLKVVAERTPGFSGADLQSLMNEAAILAARENRLKVAQFDLIRSIEKVMIGPERKSHVLSVEEKRITAYHEAGHALVASLLPFSDPVHKISIISRGHAAGYTLKLPVEERRFHTRKEFLDDIAVALGGYVAELMMFDDLTTGPSNDLSVATALAHDMVAKYGMSAEIGPIAFESSGSLMVGRGGMIEREYSEDVARRIDTEVSKIMDQQLTVAKEALAKYKHILDAIALELVRVETIEHEEFEKILILHGIQPKRKVGEKVYVAADPATFTEENVPITVETTPEVTTPEPTATEPTTEATPTPEPTKTEEPKKELEIPERAPEPIMMVTHELVRSENGEEEPKKNRKKDHKKSGGK
jgi:cell division protease FtsH